MGTDLGSIKHVYLNKIGVGVVRRWVQTEKVTGLRRATHLPVLTHFAQSKLSITQARAGRVEGGWMW
jgi:hypothetical protein